VGSYVSPDSHVPFTPASPDFSLKGKKTVGGEHSSRVACSRVHSHAENTQASRPTYPRAKKSMQVIHHNKRDMQTWITHLFCISQIRLSFLFSSYVHFRYLLLVPPKVLDGNEKVRLPAVDEYPAHADRELSLVKRQAEHRLVLSFRAIHLAWPPALPRKGNGPRISHLFKCQNS
jgi:hypothetical protein